MEKRYKEVRYVKVRVEGGEVKSILCGGVGIFFGDKEV